MKKLLALLSLTLSYHFSYCQGSYFMLERPQMRAIDSIEKANKGKLRSLHGSITISVSKDYFPGADKFKLANPLIYHRNNLVLSYYYSLPDSIIRLVEYSWEGSVETQDALMSLYKANAKRLDPAFVSKGEEKNEKHGTWEKKSITWQNDKVYVHQFLIRSESTNRLRVLVSWK